MSAQAQQAPVTLLANILFARITALTPLLRVGSTGSNVAEQMVGYFMGASQNFFDGSHSLMIRKGDEFDAVSIRKWETRCRDLADASTHLDKKVCTACAVSACALAEALDGNRKLAFELTAEAYGFLVDLELEIFSRRIGHGSVGDDSHGDKARQQLLRMFEDLN